MSLVSHYANQPTSAKISAQDLITMLSTPTVSSSNLSTKINTDCNDLPRTLMNTTTPKSSKTSARIARRALFHRTPFVAASSNAKMEELVDSLAKSGLDKNVLGENRPASLPSLQQQQKRSTSVNLSYFSAQLPFDCNIETPKTALKSSRSVSKSYTKADQSPIFNNKNVLDSKLKSAGKFSNVFETKSASNSPAILGRKVSVHELFRASTSANSSPQLKINCHSEVHNGAVSAQCSPRSPTVMTNIFATPTQRQFLRRQQSASATLVGARYGSGMSCGSLRASTATASMHAVNYRRFTPPPTKEISSPIFAASKYAESPSAKSLPMPPDEWIQEAESRVVGSKIVHASIAEDADEDMEISERPSFFISSTLSAEEDDEEQDAKSVGNDTVSSGSSGVIFDLDDALSEVEKNDKLYTKDTIESADSGEGSMSSSSDNECDSVSPSTPITKTATGIRMSPFSLIEAIGLQKINAVKG